jgi:hypothetical protein
MFKKTAIAALVLGVSGAASAAMYGPAPAPACSAGNVTVPCEKTAWDLGIRALYLKTADNVLSGTANDTFNNDSDWGFQLEGSYHFGTGNDATITWLYFDNKYGTSGNADYRKANYNVVNFELGQHVDFGENVDMRFHGGLQYASFEQTSAAAGTVNKDEGIGPRIGMNGSYNFGNGFALTGGSSMAILAADSTQTSVTTNDRDVLVNLGSDVGVKYTHAMAQGDLTLDVGYQINWVDGSRNAGDISYDGLYFGAKWVGNA